MLVYHRVYVGIGFHQILPFCGLSMHPYENCVWDIQEGLAMVGMSPRGVTVINHIHKY